jgi:hypothetical protein
MLYQLPNGKVVHISTEEFIDLTDEDIQYLMSLDYGEHLLNPFSNSAVLDNVKEKHYDFDYLPEDDDEANNIMSDDEPFDDIIDLSGPLDN